MKDFKITDDCFIIDGKPQMLLCGELQYFRMPREHWGDALDRLIECGCNAVAYYVPWFVHEYEEGKFDFTGKIHPSNDLRSWIALTREKGLLAYFRPGPYVYAETTDLGIPKWFTAYYPDAHVKGYRDGEYADTGNVNGAAHNHPDFLRAVKNWYKAVCDEIRDELAPKGNIVMIQLCNEIPGDDTDDRNPATLGIGGRNGLFPGYLIQKYGDVERLNFFYGADFQAIEKIEPHMLEQKNKRLAENDHLEYYYGYYYPAYFNTLKDFLKQNGIDDIYLAHNAYNPRAISLHYQNKKKNPWLTIGVDCYYSLYGRLGIREATYFCEYGAEYCRRFLRNVPWVVEQECGFWNDFPAVYGPELYIWNIWTAAAGYRGFNMYLFASGVNRGGMGFFGTDHNWQAPLDENGGKRGHYEAICRSLQDIRRDEEVFLSEQRYDIAFGIKNAPGLIWRGIAKASDNAYFALKTAGYTPMICDFEAASPEELLRHKVLWIVSDECMDADVQARLCGYAESGGRLVLNGRIPLRDYSDRPCTVLADKLGISAGPCPLRDDDQEKMIFNGKEYYIGKAVQPVNLPKESAILAREVRGRPCAAVVPFGKGSVCLLPFELKVSFYSTARAIRDIMVEFGARPRIEGTKLLRVIPKEKRKSVALNLNPVKVHETIKIDGVSYEVSLEPHSYRILTEKI